MLQAEQQPYSHQQPRHKDWSADKFHPPSVVEGEPSGRGKVASGFSGWAWGGSHDARPGQDAQGPLAHPSLQTNLKDKVP